MGEPQEVQLRIMASNETKQTMEDDSFASEMNQSRTNRRKKYFRWLRIAIYTVFVLVGQSGAILLGRLYYEKGAKSKWLGTLIQLVGFPILLPYYCISLVSPPKNTTNSSSSNEPSPSVLAFVYVTIGLFIAINGYLNSVGLSCLPVSTYALLGSSQLAFNAFFTYFLNSHRLTPYIVNSLILLTISSTLLVLQKEPTGSVHESKNKYTVGIICTIGACAACGLVLSFTQYVFKKVIKKETFKVVMDMTIFQSLVASVAILIGLFASGEWKGLDKEMQEYEMGKASYVLTLTFSAILWQLFYVGWVGLIFEVSSLFANAISVLGVPLVPVLAVIFFHDKMNGIKAISMVLGIWGFISYGYQQYLDDNKAITEQNTNTCHVPSSASSSQEAK